ncbi:MAG: Hpt domain-containing protein, partial [Ginsengibacter sp.]
MELLQLKYREEAIEVIEAMEKSLLSIENNLDDPALIEEVFRSMHTLKGNSSMFGFKLIADFTHHLESVYDLIRSGEIKISRQILNTSFSALDHLSLLVKNDSILNEKEKKIHKDCSEKVIEIINNTSKTKSDNHDVSLLHDNSISTEKELETYYINFSPAKNFFLNGSNPLTIINELHQFGECKVKAIIDDIPLLANYEVDNCYTSWNIFLTTDKDLKSIREIFEFVEHRCKLEIGKITKNDLIIGSSSRADNLFETNNPGTKEDNSSLPSKIKDLQNQISKNHVISSIRVPSGRLDNLMNLVSELMTLQAKLGTLTEQNPQPELLGVSESLEKIST